MMTGQEQGSDSLSAAGAEDPGSFVIASHVEEVTDLIRIASERSLEWFRQGAQGSGPVGNKASHGSFDPVTEADRSVEDEIRAGLQALFPDHAVVGEERGTTGDGQRRWIIDPIDGTRAFISGQPMWGTLVGFQDGDQVLAGWLHQPTTGETYVASPAGSWWDSSSGRRPLGTSDVVKLGDAILLCTHPSMFARPEEQAAFARVEESVKMSRFSGDCINYALLATGSADLVIENQLQPYDIIPLIPIIEAAGGVVSNLEGKPPLDGGWVIAAATVQLHAQALELLAH